MTENGGNSAKDRIQPLANSPNGNDINKELGRITQINYPTGKHPERNELAGTTTRILVARSTLDNVDHGPSMVAF